MNLSLPIPYKKEHTITSRLLRGLAKVMIVNILYTLQLNYMIIVMVINHIIIPSIFLLSNYPPPSQLMESCFSLEGENNLFPKHLQPGFFNNPWSSPALNLNHA